MPYALSYHFTAHCPGTPFARMFMCKVIAIIAIIVIIVL